MEANENKKFPSNWNGIDKMVFELATSSTIPKDVFRVQIGDVKYSATTKIVRDTIIEVRFFKNKELKATWQYGNVTGKELGTIFGGN